MKKITFIGAGSFTFTRNLVRDLLTFPAFADCEIALMDIHEERLALIHSVCDKINAAMGGTAKITSTLSRKEALEGADGVLCTVFNGDIDIWRHDIEIPKTFGVDTNIITLITADDMTELPLLSKEDAACAILDKAISLVP